jgi:hypothetical protein
LLIVGLLVVVFMQATGALKVEPLHFTLLCALLGGGGFGGVLWAIALRN